MMPLVKNTARLTVFSTHVPAEAEQYADYVIVLFRHRLQFCGTVDNLRRTAMGQVYEVVVPTREAVRLMQIHTVSRTRQAGNQSRLVVVGESPRDYPYHEVTPTLEDAYLLLIEKQI